MLYYYGQEEKLAEVLGYEQAQWYNDLAEKNKKRAVNLLWISGLLISLSVLFFYFLIMTIDKGLVRQFELNIARVDYSIVFCSVFFFFGIYLLVKGYKFRRQANKQSSLMRKVMEKIENG